MPYRLRKGRKKRKDRRKMDDEMSVGEKFVRDAYDKFLGGKESFDEDMQKTIQSELERLAKEKEEWLKKKRRVND